MIKEKTKRSRESDNQRTKENGTKEGNKKGEQYPQRMKGKKATGNEHDAQTELRTISKDEQRRWKNEKL